MPSTLCREKVVARGHNVDRQRGEIRGVRILGEHSKNGRRYEQRAMRDAVHLYEGCRVFLDHETEHSWKDWVGKLVNVRYERGGLSGDLRLRKESAHFGAIMEAAESDEFNGLFGLSHEANGTSRYDHAQGIEVITEITEVVGVAIVVDPATNKDLYESVDGMPPDITVDDADHDTTMLDGLAWLYSLGINKSLPDDIRQDARALARKMEQNATMEPVTSEPYGESVRSSSYDFSRPGSFAERYRSAPPIIHRTGPTESAREAPLVESEGDLEFNFSEPGAFARRYR